MEDSFAYANYQRERYSQSNDESATLPARNSDSGYTYKEIILHGERLAALEARKDRDAEFGERITTLENKYSHLEKDVNKAEDELKKISDIDKRIAIIENKINDEKEKRWRTTTRWLSIAAIIVSVLSPFIRHFLENYEFQKPQAIERPVQHQN